MTLPCGLPMCNRGRLANHVENRWRAYGGNRRTLDTPLKRATALRTSDPRPAPSVRFTSGAVTEPIRPSRSVRPRTWDVALDVSFF